MQTTNTQILEAIKKISCASYPEMVRKHTAFIDDEQANKALREKIMNDTVKLLAHTIEEVSKNTKDILKLEIEKKQRCK